MYKLKAQELAGVLDAFAEFFPQADIKIMVGDKVYNATSGVGIDTITGKHIILVADVDGTAK